MREDNSKGSVLVVCLSPSFEQTSVMRTFRENEVNRAYETEVTPSGKGINVSRVLGKLGTPSVSLTQLGGPRKEEFLSLCRNMDISVRAVDSGRHIRNCITIVNEEGGTSTEIVEENPEVDGKLGEAVMEAFMDEMPKHAVLVITGSMAGGFPPDLFARMVRHAGSMGKTVIADIRGEALLRAIPEGPDIIKPNLAEFMASFRPEERITEEGDSEYLFDEVASTCRTLYDRFGIRAVITRGRYDTWYWDGKELRRMAPRRIKAVNTIGCGDTFTASLADSFIRGRSLDDAVRAAMDAATERASRKELL